jgi:TPP-dependent pyruvate/acetoin dehydrogenase alpha subunit
MSDPGTTYRTREEVQRMRSTQDPIRGLQRYLEEWGVATDVELKVSSLISSLSNFVRINAYIGNR